MIIQVQSAEPRLVLLDADEFGQFAIRLADPVDLEAVLRAAKAGYLVDPSNAHIDIAAVIRLAGPRADAAWQERFVAMLGYARARHWLSEDGQHIQVHIEVAARPG